MSLNDNAKSHHLNGSQLAQSIKVSITVNIEVLYSEDKAVTGSFCFRVVYSILHYIKKKPHVAYSRHEHVSKGRRLKPTKQTEVNPAQTLKLCAAICWHHIDCSKKRYASLAQSRSVSHIFIFFTDLGLVVY